MLSVKIMAHKKRRKFVEELKPQLDGAGAVWDRKDDRWDTGRRALMAFDPAADWHLVVQDDAILCDSFLPGVRQALAGVPLEHPVSFYTGRVQPYARQVSDAVKGAQENSKSFFAMRGPLWGVAVAVPTRMIKQMVEESDDVPIANYDMRMAEWFHGQGIPCWYSVPSLVNHRVGPDNPSLVPERSSAKGRVAHTFVTGSPLDINWGSEAYIPGDPSEWWTEDGVCTRCWNNHDTLPEAIEHAYRKHGLGKIDFLASTPYHAEDLAELRSLLPVEMLGEFYVVGAEVSVKVSEDHKRLRRANARRKIGFKGPFTIVGAARDFRYIGNRPGWCIVGGEAN